MSERSVLTAVDGRNVLCNESDIVEYRIQANHIYLKIELTPGVLSDYVFNVEWLKTKQQHLFFYRTKFLTNGELIELFGSTRGSTPY